MNTHDNVYDTTYNECGEERTATHTWGEVNYVTPKTCTECGVTEVEALGYKVIEDDDCATAIQCKNCDQIAVAGASEYNDFDSDYDCDNDGCQVTVEGAPEDDSED